MSEEIALVAEVPGVAEFCAMRVDAGMSARSAEAAARGLPNSLHAVCLRKRDDGALVGMGRIVGDGGLNFEIVDVAVHRDFQRRGLGSQIVQALTDWLRDNAPPSSYVCLIADDGADALYRRFGFKLTAPVSVGMAMKM